MQFKRIRHNKYVFTTIYFMGFKSEASWKVCTGWKDSHMFAGMGDPRQQIHLRHREAVCRLAYIDGVPKFFMSAYGLIMWHVAPFYAICLKKYGCMTSIWEEIDFIEGFYFSSLLRDPQWESGYFRHRSDTTELQLPLFLQKHPGIREDVPDPI